MARSKKNGAEPKGGWANRIVGYGEEDPEALLANSKNWRIHPKNQQDALLGVLHEVGVVQNILVNRQSQMVVDGHLRVALALREGQKTIPVTYVDLSPEEEALILATLDPLAALAAADREKLGELLQGVQSGEAAIQQMLAEMAKENGLTWGTGGNGTEAPEPEIDRAAELQQKWGTALGQLWVLDDHRLICGDCTDRAFVERVMGGEKATLVCTDPPYNIGIAYESGDGDDKTAQAYEGFCRSWLGIWSEVSERQIVTPGCRNLTLWARWFAPFHIAPWTKPFSHTNGKVAHLWSWEPIFFFGGGWPRERANDIFEYPITYDDSAVGHPCPKPPQLWEDFIKHYSDLGDIVAEPFCGSGTAIVACEKLGRKARAVEISPAYCAVSLERWSQMTGKTPELDST